VVINIIQFASILFCAQVAGMLLPRTNFCRYFRTEDVKGNVMCVPFGNVTADTEFSFVYGVKKLKSKLDAGKGLL
jgi:hypothetical protein